MRGYKGVAQFKKKWKMGHPNIHIKTPFWREAGVGFGSISVKMRRKDQSPINFYKNNMCAQKHTSLFRWQNPSFFQPFSLPVQMLGSLSKAIKACQGFKEGNWRWLKWKVRMWGQCWNSLNGRPVSGWSIMDSVLKALGLIHLNIREDWIHQRTSQCNSKSSLWTWKRSL